MIFQGVSKFYSHGNIESFETQLKTWNKEVFGKMEDRKKQALDNVAILGCVR